MPKRFFKVIRSLENLSSGEKRAGCADFVGVPSGASFCMMRNAVEVPVAWLLCGNDSKSGRQVGTYQHGVNTLACIVRVVHQVHLEQEFDDRSGTGRVYQGTLCTQDGGAKIHTQKSRPYEAVLQFMMQLLVHLLLYRAAGISDRSYKDTKKFDVGPSATESGACLGQQSWGARLGTAKTAERVHM